MKRIVISIPVHEQPDVIINQIENIKKYVCNVSIVLHVSRTFYEKYNDSTIANIKDIYINPTHLETDWGDIIHTHISNFNYIDSILKFDCFIMHSSNDMYIKSGINDYIEKYDSGFNIRKIVQKYSHWWPGDSSFNDEILSKIKVFCGQPMTIASQIEGSFYGYDTMKKIISIISNNYRRDEKDIKYTREEIYFSTIASSFIDWTKIGKPTTFSEVHRFDRFNWALREKTRKLHKKLKIFVSQKKYDRFEVFFNSKLFNSRFYKITKKDISSICINNYSYLEKNSYLDDGSGLFNLYDCINLYSVKRVPRDMNDPIRKFITNKSRVNSNEEII